MANVSSSNGLGKRPKLRFPGFDEPWNETALEELGNFYNGLSGKDKSDFGKGADYYITYMNVYKNVIADVNGCDVVSIKEGEHQNRVNFGDLLFTQSSETLEEVGLTSVWLNNGTPLLNSFCFGFHFDATSLINPRFAAYSMRTPYARKRITREGQGATRYNLSSNRLKKVKILYPSHSEQDKIAGLLSLLEARIEKQCEIIDQLKKYKRGVTAKLITAIEEKYSVVKLGNHVAVMRGGSPRPIDAYITNAENGIRWIKIGDALPDQLYISDTKEKIKPEGAKKSRRVYAGDLILSNSMSFGRPYILKVDGCIHDGWLLIRDEKNNFDKRFLCFYLASDSTLAQYKKFAAGSCVNNLNSELVANVEIGMPPIEQQIHVADILEKIDRQVEAASTMYLLLSKLRNSLLQQLFI